ncbi:hypothetical protein ColTof4_13344 [Colletotrichum tofieldiae]|nr:hypothetical protein ColTof3_00582 [Colletotrichum tofieldiae]GKT80921.1 hypothetical protein ColTof4_13344 [Colletotrichum tofieldiae]
MTEGPRSLSLGYSLLLHTVSLRLHGSYFENLPKVEELGAALDVLAVADVTMLIGDEVAVLNERDPVASILIRRDVGNVLGIQDRQSDFENGTVVLLSDLNVDTHKHDVLVLGMAHRLV